MSGRRTYRINRCVLICLFCLSLTPLFLLVFDGLFGTSLLDPIAILESDKLLFKNEAAVNRVKKDLLYDQEGKLNDTSVLLKIDDVLNKQFDKKNELHVDVDVLPGVLFGEGQTEYPNSSSKLYYEDVFPDDAEQPVLPLAVYGIPRPDAPGENGTGVNINTRELDKETMNIYSEGIKNHRFNQYVSDMISVRRTVPDNRPSSCPMEYSKDLPSTSIIICFYNEAWSVLLRTVHSVLDRTPPYLIKEIILVDDFSTMDHLKVPLTAYMKNLPKVRILRTTKREGLVRARLIGVDEATAPVLTFLDSHVECLPGCLEPLLDRVAHNESILVSPNIIAIHSETFAVETAPPRNVGMFKLVNIFFGWMPIPQRELERLESAADPYRTPAIAGGLFSISRQFFNHIGRYDEGMDIWGVENIEISVRVWTCGGSMEIHPCSSFAHIFRQTSPYMGWKVGHVVQKNTLRFTEVWLDDYKYKYHMYVDRQDEIRDFGDISDRKRLRSELQCKPFQWYIDNVYPEIEIPPALLFKGQIRQVGEPAYCLSNNKIDILMAECHFRNGYQLWRLTDKGELRSWREGCIEVSKDGKSAIYTLSCRKQNVWSRGQDDRLRSIEGGRCLERHWDTTVTLENCSDNETMQVWDFMDVKL